MRPPVAEVICGIQFQDVPRWATAQFGRFWSEIASEYPETEDQSPLAKLSPDMKIRRPEGQILEYPPLRRVFLKESNGRHLMQIQADRFLHSWRKTSERDEYPTPVLKAITAQDATGKALQASNMFLHFDWTLPDNAGILSLEVKHGSRVPDQKAGIGFGTHLQGKDHPARVGSANPIRNRTRCNRKHVCEIDKRTG